VTQSLLESQPRISGHTLYNSYNVQFGTCPFPSQFDSVGAILNYQQTAIFILKIRTLRYLFTHTTDLTNVKIFAGILLLEVHKRKLTAWQASKDLF
jgi:hypothetical protein